MLGIRMPHSVLLYKCDIDCARNDFWDYMILIIYFSASFSVHWFNWIFLHISADMAFFFCQWFEIWPINIFSMFHLDQGDSRCLPSISSCLNAPLNIHYVLKSLPNCVAYSMFPWFLNSNFGFSNGMFLVKLFQEVGTCGNWTW